MPYSCPGSTCRNLTTREFGADIARDKIHLRRVTFGRSDTPIKQWRRPPKPSRKQSSLNSSRALFASYSCTPCNRPPRDWGLAASGRADPSAVDHRDQPKHEPPYLRFSGFAGWLGRPPSGLARRPVAGNWRCCRPPKLAASSMRTATNCTWTRSSASIPGRGSREDRRIAKSRTARSAQSRSPGLRKPVVAYSTLIDLLCVKGEILSSMSQQDASEGIACLLEALEEAQQRGLLSLELRSGISLASDFGLIRG